jgi:hypothetical protein
MEHELFQSKLKPSVDVTLASDIIRSSSSGLDLHRTAAIELVLERSIQERRGRVPTKAKNGLRRDSTPQPKRTNGAPGTPPSQEQSPAPAPATQPPSQSLPDDTAEIVAGPASASTKHEGLQVSSAPSEPANMIKVVPREEPPADVEANPSPSEVFVELACRRCHVKQLRSGLRSGVRCGLCLRKCPQSEKIPRMKCAGCETTRFYDVDACTSCHGKFK